MALQLHSIDDLADHVIANLKPGEEFEVDPATWDRLSFDSSRYDMAYKALDARLGNGWEQSTDVTNGREGRVLIRRR
jgi:hypothetical protein